MAEDTSVSTLFSDLIGQVSSLFRTEVRLAKTELSEKLNHSLGAVGYLIAGGSC